MMKVWCELPPTFISELNREDMKVGFSRILLIIKIFKIMDTITHDGSESTINNNSRPIEIKSCNNLKSKKMEKIEIIKKLGQPKINRLMDEKKYWLIIGTAFNYNTFSNIPFGRDKLDSLMSNLNLKELIQFHLRTLDLMNKLHSSAFGTASIIMNGVHVPPCNDEFHSSFRGWIISLGERVFNHVLTHPDYLVNFAVERFDKYYFYYGLDFSAAYEFNERTGFGIENFIGLDRVTPKAESSVSEVYKSEKTAQRTCPILFEKFKPLNKKRDRKEKNFQKRIQKTREKINQLKNAS